MALNKAVLKTGIKNLLTDMRAKEDISDDEFAERFASLIDGYIKEAKINYVSGLATSQGPVTGSFVGKLS